ncbi:MAG TPA: flagellar basal body L-ring protein FlgH [Gammaproteobacteria bacterium]
MTETRFDAAHRCGAPRAASGPFARGARGTRASRWTAGAVIASAALLSACATGPGIHQGSDPRFQATMPAEPLPSEHNLGAIYQPMFAQSLFEDYKARRVGDVLTVLLVERTEAQKSANASTSKDASVNLPAPTLGGRTPTHQGLPIFQAEGSGTRSFEGQGGAAQSNMLEGSIAVTVANVLPNGNLVVQGEKWVRINQGEEYIRLRGIVRPVDIGPDNTVLSTQVADAEVAYGGTGVVASSSMPGWLSRFFSSPLWPL